MLLPKVQSPDHQRRQALLSLVEVAASSTNHSFPLVQLLPTIGPSLFPGPQGHMSQALVWSKVRDFPRCSVFSLNHHFQIYFKPRPVFPEQYLAQNHRMETALLEPSVQGCSFVATTSVNVSLFYSHGSFTYSYHALAELLALSLNHPAS